MTVVNRNLDLRPLREPPQVEHDDMEYDFSGARDDAAGSASQGSQSALLEAIDEDEYQNMPLDDTIDLTEEELQVIFAAARAKWTPPSEPSRYLEWAIGRFWYVDDNDRPTEPLRIGDQIQFVDLYKLYGSEVKRVIMLRYHYEKKGWIGNENEEQQKNKEWFGRIMESIAFTYYSVEGYYRSYNAMNPVLDEYCPLEVATFRFKLMDISECNQYQKFLLYILKQLHTYGYRRYKGECYRQIASPLKDNQNEPIMGQNGKPIKFKSHAWEPACKIPTFIHKVTPKETCFAQWSNMTSMPSCIDRTTKYLLESEDLEFLQLEPNRNTWSFPNGVYDGKNMVFYSHTDGVPFNITACKYFDNYFPVELMNEADWYHNIPTPNFERILEYQKMGNTQEERTEIHMWMYIMLGRMFYNVNEFDRWAITIFIKGIAKSGKSTIGENLANAYLPADVGNLSSNAQTKFGLSAIEDRFIAICYEMDKHFAYAQSEMQSAMVGESVQMNIKFATAKTLTWVIPFLLLGNEVADWVDKQGSMTRRILLFEFLKKVKDADPYLKEQLQKEMPYFILKCNMAYRITAAGHAKTDIWKLVPDYFHRTRDRLRARINPLVAFLNDKEKFEIKPYRYIHLKSFQDLYNMWLKENKFDKVKFDTDHYESVFEEYGFTVKFANRIKWGDAVIDGYFIKGIGSMQQALDSAECFETMGDLNDALPDLNPPAERPSFNFAASVTSREGLEALQKVT